MSRATSDAPRNCLSRSGLVRAAPGSAGRAGATLPGSGIPVCAGRTEAWHIHLHKARALDTRWWFADGYSERRVPKTLHPHGLHGALARSSRRAALSPSIAATTVVPQRVMVTSQIAAAHKSLPPRAWQRTWQHQPLRSCGAGPSGHLAGDRHAPAPLRMTQRMIGLPARYPQQTWVCPSGENMPSTRFGGTTRHAPSMRTLSSSPPGDS